jgi:hypothetical protein
LAVGGVPFAPCGVVRSSHCCGIASRAGSITPVPWRDPPPELRLGAASTPFLAAPPHVGFDGARGFRLLNREIRFADAIDWDVQEAGPLWAYHLHQFDYLRRPELGPEARVAAMLDWVDRHHRGVGWNPHPTSLRTMNWIKLLLTNGALVLDARDQARLRASLGSQLATLARHLDTHLLANHYLSNLLALVFGGLVFVAERADRWLSLERELLVELEEQILSDGAHVERSPMYHALLLEGMLDLLNVAGALPERVSPALDAALRDVVPRMLGALEVWTHPDGRIALFGDSAFDIAQEPATLHGYAEALGLSARRPAREGVLERGGFVRLAAGPFSLIASTGEIRPPYQPGHAHADGLSFELCIAAERIVTDTGVPEYVPGELRDLSRATSSHATVEVGGEDQAELWAAHRVGGRPRLSLVALEPGRSAEATCSGWATPATTHRRRFHVEPDRAEIRDRIEGRSEPVRLTLPLAPHLEVRLEGARAQVRLRRGDLLEIVLPEGPAWRLERLPYFPEFGRRLERPGLVGEAARFEEGLWIFRLRRGG